MKHKEVKDKVNRLVKKACFSPNNKFTHTVWKYHILPVVEHSLTLGKKLKADLEVLELAAYLHDYSGLVSYKLYKDHHIHGASMVEEILIKYKYPEDKIAKIKHCIMSHRASVRIKHKTIEAVILASADAMSHITELADMFYLTFGVHKYQTDTGVVWLRNKLKRSWNKIMPEGKKLIKKDYINALKILNNNK